MLEQSQVEAPPASRTIEGVVVDADGQPVHDALIVVATTVQADGRRLRPLWSARAEIALGVREGRSDSRGRFSIGSVADAAVAVIAEDMDRGRSQHMVVEESAAGDDLRLVLQPTGRIEGRIRVGTKPGAGQFISIAPEPVAMPAKFGALVATAADGSFAFERVAPGRYRLFVNRDSSSQSAALESTQVVVTPGGVATLELDLRGGDGSLEVRVRGEGGATIPSAQIIVMPPGFRGTRGKDINARALDGEPLSTAFWAEGKAVEIGGLAAGSYSMCVVPLGGDFRNPEYMSALTPEDIAETAVHCQEIEIAAGQPTAIVAEVPPMVEPRSPKSGAAPKSPAAE